jgi:hypothetical protein
LAGRAEKERLKSAAEAAAARCYIVAGYAFGDDN